MISIRKRGNSYQYCFDIGKVNGKRKQMTKCGFRTKSDVGRNILNYPFKIIFTAHQHWTKKITEDGKIIIY